MMKTMKTMDVADALRAGFEANFAPPEQAAELAKFTDLLLGMAASLEMLATNPETGLPADKVAMRHADLLGKLAMLLDRTWS